MHTIIHKIKSSGKTQKLFSSISLDEVQEKWNELCAELPKPQEMRHFYRSFENDVYYVS